MKITYANLRGFKRFHNSRIAEFEAEFVSPVQIVVGANSSGKSSVLRELSPLPSIRTDYEKNGRKELHIEHENHNYELVTDFSSRVSPHSFKKDGVELNDGHTSQVQEELAIKEFGFTPAIRNLIYGKVAVCSMTPVNRKNMFLAINPMDLSLILDSFKVALQHFKDLKANMQLLYSRKGSLEAKMLKPDLLAQHIATKEKLENWSLELDKILFGLKQHIDTIKDRFRDELDYKNQCNSNDQPLIPKERMMLQCKEIIRKAHTFTNIPRGSDFDIAYDKLKVTHNELKIKIQNLENHIKDLTTEINEYQTQLDKTNGERKVSDVEKDILEIDNELENFKNLPVRPIPEYLIDSYINKSLKIKELLFTVEGFDFKLKSREELISLYSRADEIKFGLNSLNEKIGTLTSLISDEENELKTHKEKAGIPAGCNFSSCGLRILFDRRYKEVEEKLTNHKKVLSELTRNREGYTLEMAKIGKILEPFTRNNVLSLLENLYTALRDEHLQFHNWDTELLHILNTAPLSIYKEIDELITGSKLYYQAKVLKERRSNLETELSAMMKTSGASIDFLKKKITEKTLLNQKDLATLDILNKEYQKVDSACALYLDYATTCDEVTSMLKIYSRGERALLVSKAIEYWHALGKHLFECKKKINEELRELESIVKEQEIIKHTYESETLTLIDKIAHERLIYEKLCDSLNPNTGLPFKSMVNYLNSIINNVNYFLGQLWNFKLDLPKFSLEEALDYNFKINIGSETVGDINHLSDGQTEVVNFAFELAILLQMKSLDKIPLYADELGRAMDPTHRLKLLNFLKQLVDSKLVNQIFLINHYAALSDGFTDSDIIALDTTNLPELPHDLNRHVHIVRY